MGAVYILNNMTIHDRAEYGKYLRAFMGVFERYQGEILAVADAPVPAKGVWPYARTILLRFPSREIAQHRVNGTTSNVVFLDAFVPPR